MKQNYVEVADLEMFGRWNLQDLSMVGASIPREMIIKMVRSSVTSMGVLKKFNVIKDGRILYVKSGQSLGNYYSIRQPIVEKICSDIGNLLGFDVISYGLWIIDKELFDMLEDKEDRNYWEFDGPSSYHIVDENISFQKALSLEGKVLVSVSKNFLGRYDEFFSCEKLYPDVRSRDLYECISSSDGPQVKEKLDQMIVFDFLVHNTDRHKGNFGFIRNEGSHRLTPLFDHGLALLSSYEDSILEEEGLDVLGYEAGKPFGNLAASLRNVDRSSLSNIRWEVSSEDLFPLIERYRSVLGSVRTDTMKSVINLRWNYVRKIFSKV